MHYNNIVVEFKELYSHIKFKGGRLSLRDAVELKNPPNRDEILQLIDQGPDRRRLRGARERCEHDRENPEHNGASRLSPRHPQSETSSSASFETAASRPPQDGDDPTLDTITSRAEHS